jgi:hypothetical protein
VIAGVEVLAHDAAVRACLLRGLGLLVPREESSGGDSRVQERGIVRSAIERRGLGGERILPEVPEEDLLDVADPSGPAFPKSEPSPSCTARTPFGEPTMSTLIFSVVAASSSSLSSSTYFLDP